MLPVPVAQNLDFDVFGAADVAFEENGVVAECSARLPGALRPAGLRIRSGEFDHAHAASAASERGFDDQRESRCLWP